MAHFALVGDDGIVQQICVLNNEDILDENGQESEEMGIEICKQTTDILRTWVQTSYNGNFRNKYALIGDTYRADLDAFIEPSPYPSWVLNEQTLEWEAPIPKPED